MIKFVALVLGLLNQSAIGQKFNTQAVTFLAERMVDLNCVTKPSLAIHPVGYAKYKIQGSITVLVDDIKTEIAGYLVIIARKNCPSADIEDRAMRPSDQKILGYVTRTNATAATTASTPTWLKAISRACAA